MLSTERKTRPTELSVEIIIAEIIILIQPEFPRHSFDRRPKHTLLSVCMWWFPPVRVAPPNSQSGLSIKRTSRRALIRCQIINMECFLGAGFTVWASWHRPCDSGAASSSHITSIHQQVWVTERELVWEWSLGRLLLQQHQYSSKNWPKKQHKQLSHNVLYRWETPPTSVLNRATEGEHVRDGFHAEELVYVFIIICFHLMKHAQVWSQVPSDCSACPVRTSNCSSEESALSGPSV